MTDNPKVMFNQGEGKFTAMDPKDDNLVNKIYNFVSKNFLYCC